MRQVFVFLGWFICSLYAANLFIELAKQRTEFSPEIAEELRLRMVVAGAIIAALFATFVGRVRR